MVLAYSLCKIVSWNLYMETSGNLLGCAFVLWLLGTFRPALATKLHAICRFSCWDFDTFQGRENECGTLGILEDFGWILNFKKLLLILLPLDLLLDHFFFWPRFSWRNFRIGFGNFNADVYSQLSDMHMAYPPLKQSPFAQFYSRYLQQSISMWDKLMIGYI